MWRTSTFGVSLEALDCLRRGAAALQTAPFTRPSLTDLAHTPDATSRVAGRRAQRHCPKFVAAAVATDRRALETIGQSLSGTDRPLVAAFGTLAMKPGQSPPKTRRMIPTSSELPAPGRKIRCRSWLRGAFAPQRSAFRRSSMAPAITACPAANRDRTEEERIGIHRRRWQPMALGAPARRRAALSAGSGEGTWGRNLSRRRRRRHPVPRHRRPHRPASQSARRQQVSCGGCQAVWFSRTLCQHRQPDIQQVDPGTAGMASNSARLNVRSRPRRLLQSMSGLRAYPTVVV